MRMDILWKPAPSIGMNHTMKLSGRRHWRFFKTTLLMCIFARPDKDKLHIFLDEFEEFYEFLNGPRIAQSSPPPTLAKLKIMERKAWYNINLAMHKDEDLTIKEAIRQTIADHLFWTQELNVQKKRWTPEPWSHPKRQRNMSQNQTDSWSPQSPGKGQSKPRSTARSQSAPSRPRLGRGVAREVKLEEKAEENLKAKERAPARILAKEESNHRDATRTSTLETARSFASTVNGASVRQIADSHTFAVY